MTVSVELDKAQREFLEKHLLKRRAFGLSKDRDAKVEQGFKSYIAMKRAVTQLVAGLPADMPERQAKKTSFLRRIDENHKLIAGKGKSKKKLVEAKEGLTKIQLDIIEYSKILEVEDFTRSPKGRVWQHNARYQKEMRAKVEEIDTREAEVLGEMRKLAETRGVEVPEELHFSKRARDLQSRTLEAFFAEDPKAPDDVDPAKRRMDESFGDFTKEIGAIRQELEAFAKNKEKNVEFLDHTKRCEGMRSTLGAVQESAESLDTWGVAEAPGFLNEAFRLSLRIAPELPETDIAALEGEVRQLATKVRTRRMKHQKEYRRRKLELAKMHEEINQEAKRYDEEFSHKGVKAPQVQEANFLLTMSRNAMNTGMNLAALEPVAKMLEDARKLVFDLQNITVLNPEIEKRIGELDSVIKKHEGSKGIRPQAWQGHRDWLTQFRSDWIGMRPAEARSKIIAYAVTVKEEEDREAKQKEWRARQHERLKSIKSQLDEIGKTVKELAKTLAAKGEKGMDYDGALLRDYNTCVEWIDTKEALSWQAPTEQKIGELQVAVLETHDALTGKGRDPTDPKKTAEQIRLEAQQKLMQEYDAVVQAKEDAASGKTRTLDDIRNWLVIRKKDAKALAAYKSYKDEYDTLFKQVDDLRKNVKKDIQTPDQASKALERFEERFDTLKKRPAKVDRGKLGQIHVLWGQGVDSLKERSEKLAGAVEALDSAAAGTLRQSLAAVESGFRSASFADAARVLGDETTTEAERLRARETALSAVRVGRDRLMGDPLVKACVDNPFGVAGFATSVYKKLNEIELEVSRGV